MSDGSVAMQFEAPDDWDGNSTLFATGETRTLDDGSVVPVYRDMLGPIAEPDPGNLHPQFVHAWADLASTSELPVHAYTAALLARTVEAVRYGGAHTQERYVPEVMRRICVLLEDLGLGADTTVRLEADVEDLVRVLVAELNAETRSVVHNRLQTDLAATLIPRLSGGTKS